MSALALFERIGILQAVLAWPKWVSGALGTSFCFYCANIISLQLVASSTKKVPEDRMITTSDDRLFTLLYSTSHRRVLNISSSHFMLSGRLTPYQSTLTRDPVSASAYLLAGQVCCYFPNQSSDPAMLQLATASLLVLTSLPSSHLETVP